MDARERQAASAVEKLNEALDNAFAIAHEYDFPIPLFMQRWRLAQRKFQDVCDLFDLPWEEHIQCISRLPNSVDAGHIRCMILVSPLFVAELVKREPEVGPNSTELPLWARLQAAGIIN